MQFKKDKQNQLTSFLKGEKIRMYLYVVNAFSIPSKKAGTLPNPYLVVKLGEKDVKNVVTLLCSFMRRRRKNRQPLSSTSLSKKIWSSPKTAK